MARSSAVPSSPPAPRAATPSARLTATRRAVRSEVQGVATQDVATRLAVVAARRAAAAFGVDLSERAAAKIPFGVGAALGVGGAVSALRRARAAEREARAATTAVERATAVTRARHFRRRAGLLAASAAASAVPVIGTATALGFDALAFGDDVAHQIREGARGRQPNAPAAPLAPCPAVSATTASHPRRS
jgi:hypothetical protein